MIGHVAVLAAFVVHALLVAQDKTKGRIWGGVEVNLEELLSYHVLFETLKIDNTLTEQLRKMIRSILRWMRKRRT